MRLDVLVTSNEGWYAFNVDSVARRIFNSAFDAIFSALRNAAPGISQSTQGQHEQLVVAFNELIELLRTSNESEVAVSLEEDRVGIEAGTQPAMDHLDAALSPDGILGKLVINYADGREIAGKEFSGANRRLQELEEVCRKALRDRPQV